MSTHQRTQHQHSILSLIPRLHDTTGCHNRYNVQPVWQPAVYTIQPVDKAVWQPVVSCLHTFNRLSNRFDNWFDNRLSRVNGALVKGFCWSHVIFVQYSRHSAPATQCVSQTQSKTHAPLPTSTTLSLSHSWLKTYIFHKSLPLQTRVTATHFLTLLICITSGQIDYRYANSNLILQTKYSRCANFMVSKQVGMVFWNEPY